MISLSDLVGKADTPLSQKQLEQVQEWIKEDWESHDMDRNLIKLVKRLLLNINNTNQCDCECHDRSNYEMRCWCSCSGKAKEQVLQKIGEAIDVANKFTTHEHDSFAKCIDELFKAKGALGF